MLKKMSIVMILLGLTNTNYSQSKIIPKSVEARMSQNRQSQKSTLEDAHLSQATWAAFSISIGL